MSTTYVYGTGRRKTAVARVRLLPGDGSIVVNGKPSASTSADGAGGALLLPFRVTETEGRYSASVLVAGGGVSARSAPSGTGSHERCSRAHPDARRRAREAGLLTRDPRAKERKKYGLKRARKARSTPSASVAHP
jgi:small subunit ribosomal protein S9